MRPVIQILGQYGVQTLVQCSALDDLHSKNPCQNYPSKIEYPS